jgi:thiol:disulfide interchange protein DsbC
MRRLTLLWGLLVSAGFSFAGVCDEVDLSKHIPFLPGSVKVVSKREVYSLCEMVLQDRGGFFTVYGTKDYVIVGELLSLGKNLSREGITSVQSRMVEKMLPELRSLAAVVYGSGQKEVFFVSDPDCPFCNGIKRKVKELADKNGYKVYLLWFPLPIHPKAKEKAVSFICEKRTFEDYLSDAYGKSNCSEGVSKVEKALEVLGSIVNATPTFIFSDGRIVVGGNPKVLEEEMK